MTINYDHNSFIINGEKVFINSAAIHYFRMPKQEWREVLLKAKFAGMNCIDTYFAWNVHEAEEGKFYFEEDMDCGHFIDLCAELGLWVIARPGPFICAEWDFGGLPWWLRKKPNIEYRIDNDNYMHYVFRYFDHLLPIISKRQITNGGPVILVQVENEYGYLAESERGKNYMNLLRDGILQRDITVPLITCVGGAEGTIECANFWTGAKQHYERLVQKQPNTPKIVTEFWTGWFEHWGGMAALQKTPLLYEKKLLEVISAGFDGINHYMFFGGTNFANYGGRTVGSSDIFMITSYDYDAPLNEYGRITDKYKVAKKFSQFTNVLSALLLDAKVGDASVLHATKGLELSILESCNEQRLIFAENIDDERKTYFIKLSGVALPIVIEAGQMVPILDRVTILDGLRMSTGGYLLANESYPERQVIIIAGGIGQRLSVLLEVDELNQIIDQESIIMWSLAQSSHVRHQWLVEQKKLLLDVYLFEEVQIIKLKFNDRQIEFLLINDNSAAETWHLQDDKVDWVIGYVDIQLTDHQQYYGVKNQNRSLVYINQYETIIENSNDNSACPKLSDWMTSKIALNYENSQVFTSPQGFSAVNKDFGYMLYSHELNCEVECETTLALTEIQDPARVFVNGVHQGIVTELGVGGVNVKLRSGSNVIQFLTQHMGRLNFSPYLGEEKGIFGPIYVDAQLHEFRDGWELEGQLIHLSELTHKDDYPVIRKVFEIEGRKRVLIAGVLSEILIINGHKVNMEGYANWFHFQSIDITQYIHSGENIIEMQLTQTPTLRLQLIVCDENKCLANWFIRDFFELNQMDLHYEPSLLHSFRGTPVLHKATFNWESDTVGAYTKLKLRMTNMSKGCLYINGKLLGRYWQVGPQEDYKVPLSWLQEGENELVIFDELGQSPHAIRLIIDQQSCETWIAI